VEKERTTKERQKPNLDKEGGKGSPVIEAKKKHADKPIPVAWYGQKKDNKRSF
jgi:hypothetical protein